MRRRHKRIKNYIICLIVVFILAITIGYAQIDSIVLNIFGSGTSAVNDQNFNVHFTNVALVTGTGSATVIDGTTAEITASGLSVKDDEFEAEFFVKNDSRGIAAEFDLVLNNTDTDYIRVTKTIEKKQLAAGETASVTVKVVLLQTVFENDFTSTITGTIIAKPLDNDSITNTDPESVIGLEESRFNSYSWDKIKQDVDNDRLDNYNVGDTKIISVSNKDYRVRLVNKDTTSDCSNSNYSETGCGFIVEFLDMPVTMSMLESTETTSNPGYENSLPRQYLNTLYNSFPQELQSVIATTRVVSGHNNNVSNNYVTNDKLFLLSPTELGVYKYYDSTNGYTRTLDYYKDSSSNNNIRLKYYGKDSFWYWTRTAQLDSSTAFYHVNNDGRVAAQNFTTERGIAPAFRIKKENN